MEMSEHDSKEVRTSPSVSKDKWLQHAVKKLSNGYLLVVGDRRRNANFFKAGKGYEMCAYNVALQLVRDGLVTHAYAHHLGTAYVLSPEAAAQKASTETRPAKANQDVEVFLHQLGGADETGPPPTEAF